MISNTVFIGIGTNLGDRRKNIEDALRNLGSFINIRKVSSTYETEPVDYEDQGWFLNLVVCGTTELSPEDLLAKLKETESLMGRTPTFEKGPRVIDLDILLYSDLVFRAADLTIPHPEMHKRSFVLTPLREIAPEVVHPELGKTIADLSADLVQGGQVRIWDRTGTNDSADR